MLENLYIKDFILIEQLSLQFCDGFSVFTGETGAGKSIFIDAVSTLLGQRMSTSMIRPGAEKAIVEGQFTVTKRLAERLTQAGYEDEELIVTREIDTSGKSITRLNQRLSTASFLKDLLSDVVDIHCQNDNQYLLNEKSHRPLIDEFANDQTLLQQTAESYHKYHALQKQKDDLLATSFNPAQLQTMEFQLKEITDANVLAEEDEKIAEQLSQMNNYEKIQQTVTEFNELMDNDVLDKLYEATRLLEKLNNSNSIAESTADFSDAYFRIKDDVESIQSYYQDFSLDQAELDQLNARLFKIQNLKRKYATDITGLNQLKIDLQNQLDQYSDKENVLANLDKQIKQEYESFEQVAIKLRSVRQQAAEQLQQLIEQQIRPLNLQAAVFKVEITPTTASATGLDEIKFLISMNHGQPLQPLNKVASGGELSRLMLGLKTIFNKLHKTELVIFDEIDTGVSGYVAFNMGQRMYDIAKSCQVFAITHLASVAAFGQQHYRISKKQDEKSTVTNVMLLSEQARISELAILSSSDTSLTSLQAAAELRKRATDATANHETN